MTDTSPSLEQGLAAALASAVNSAHEVKAEPALAAGDVPFEAASLAETLSNALKRPRSPEPEPAGGDDKRVKTEATPSSQAPASSPAPAPVNAPATAPTTAPGHVPPPTPPVAAPQPATSRPAVVANAANAANTAAKSAATQASIPLQSAASPAAPPQATPPPQAPQPAAQPVAYQQTQHPVAHQQQQQQQKHQQNQQHVAQPQVPHAPVAQIPPAPLPVVQQPVNQTAAAAALPEPVAAGWDVAAMLESALEDFDDQAFKNLLSVETDANTPATKAPEPAPPVPVVPVAPQIPVPVPPLVRPKQKKMKFHESPTYIVRSMGLPYLGTLAVQVLLALSEKPRVETINAIRSSDSDVGKAYKALSATFKAARNIFSDTSSILQADELEITESGDLETIQMANLATICSTIFETDNAPLLEAHNGFLRTFLPEYSPLTDNLTSLFLSLKTQALLRACPETAEESRMRELLEICFPADAEAPLKHLHPDSPLTQTEKVFVSMSTKRGERLANEVRDTMKRKLLAIEYPWDGLLDDLNKYLRDNHEAILTYAESQGIEIPVDEDSIPEPQMDTSVIDLSALQAATQGTGQAVNCMGAAMAHAGLHAALADGMGLSKPAHLTTEKDKAQETETLGLASLIAERMGTHAVSHPYQHPQAGIPYNNGIMHNGYMAPQPQYLNAPYHQQQQHQHQQQQQQYIQGPVQGNAADLPPNQSSPSTVLYERARQAAVAKSTVNNTRRDGLSSTRRPWSPEEERALMTGLDMVKGPHWSQILSLFGPNGTINDILKDRSQVQLKDKARNLKLFFLKTNSEMPYYLQSVTGELKTRAPNLSARKAREMEQAGANATDEQARAQGVGGVLAGATQDSKAASPAPPICSPLTPAGSVNGGRTGSPSTPLQAQAKVPIPPTTTSGTGPMTAAQTPHLTNGAGARSGVASTIGVMSPHAYAAQARTAAAAAAAAAAASSASPAQQQAPLQHAQSYSQPHMQQQGAPQQQQQQQQQQQHQQQMQPRQQTQPQVQQLQPHQRPLPAQMHAARPATAHAAARPQATQMAAQQKQNGTQQLPAQQAQNQNPGLGFPPRPEASQAQATAAQKPTTAPVPQQQQQQQQQNQMHQQVVSQAAKQLQPGTPNYPQKPTTAHPSQQQQQQQQHSAPAAAPPQAQLQQTPTNWQVKGSPVVPPAAPQPGQQMPRPPINGLQQQTALPAYLQGDSRPTTHQQQQQRQQTPTNQPPPPPPPVKKFEAAPTPPTQAARQGTAPAAPPLAAVDVKAEPNVEEDFLAHLKAALSNATE